MATNLEGSYNAARACYPHMRAAGRGKVGRPASCMNRVRHQGAHVPCYHKRAAAAPAWHPLH